MIIGKISEWNKPASELLKQFLNSGVGQNFLANLAARRPPLDFSCDDVNRVALRAKLAEGYERAINDILILSEPPVKEAGDSVEQYPPIDDESQWGAKSEPKKDE